MQTLKIRLSNQGNLIHLPLLLQPDLQNKSILCYTGKNSLMSPSLLLLGTLCLRATLTFSKCLTLGIIAKKYFIDGTIPPTGPPPYSQIIRLGINAGSTVTTQEFYPTYGGPAL